jgi:Spy/CpxP family protein refolding chaperone
MKTLIVAFLSAVLFTFCSTGISNAQQKDSEKGQKTGKEMNGMMQHRNDFIKKLKLTDAQKEKIKDLRTAFQKNIIDLRADLKKNQIDLKALKSKDNLTRDEITAAVGKVNSSRDAISLAVANHLFDLYQVLTPEQQKIWKENAYRMHMWGGRGHGGFGRFRRAHHGFDHFGGWHKGFDQDKAHHEGMDHKKGLDKDSAGKDN